MFAQKIWIEIISPQLKLREKALMHSRGVLSRIHAAASFYGYSNVCVCHPRAFVSRINRITPTSPPLVESNNICFSSIISCLESGVNIDPRQLRVLRTDMYLRLDKCAASWASFSANAVQTQACASS